MSLSEEWESPAITALDDLARKYEENRSLVVGNSIEVSYTHLSQVNI